MNRFPDVKAIEITVPPELAYSIELPATSLQLRESFLRLQKEFDETFGLWSCRDQIQIVQSMLPENEFSQFLAGHSVCLEITFQETGQGEGILSIPLEDETGDTLIAFTKIQSGLAKTYTSLANLLLDKIKLEFSHQQLQSQNEAFLHQISADMEELTYLRQLHTFLELKTDPQNGTGELLKRVALQVQSTWIGFLPVHSSTSSHQVLELFESCVQNPESGHDFPNIPPSSLRPLVNQFSHQHGIVVKNHINQEKNGVATSASAGIPSWVESLLLCPVEKSNHQFGWLIAVNRLPNRQLNHPLENRLQKSEFGSVEAGLLTSAAAMLATHFSNLDLLATNKELMTNVVRCLVAAIESKDTYTCGHSERVARFGRRIGQELGLDDKTVERIY
ncbi:MAG: hypothetical protein VX438_10370, partial [Planctomycetota bacterium]|nr:hypothetical protein [Planctomycetota bacterium]